MTTHALDAQSLKEKKRSWVLRNRFLLLRRSTQLLVLALFLAGPWAGVWIVKGTLTSSMTLNILPLSDPFLLLQTMVTGHWPELTGLIGLAIVVVSYAVFGGRLYCSWVCPMNVVTDSANWLHRKLDLKKGWQPKKHTRYWVLAMTLLVAAGSGSLAYELVNPVTLLHRGLVFGMGFAWAAVLMVFLFDTFVSRHGWCGHLCPMGAVYGLLNTKSLLRISAKNREACDDCMDCFEVCPENHVISPALRGKGDDTPLIQHRDCTSCGRCIDVCDLDVFSFTHRFDTQLIQPTSIEPGPRDPVTTKAMGGHK
ncbi:quinol dehydrogenase ferredoxin subunit NapH [Pseudovibrio brasiliensis]|uniref:Quinol dehydrogenase ferredoxin subunit NapH n=1 Tax=Pseudovibrio brasiliensis TaxID=1898042 RepID=A0ABX8AJ45_9HYPH|nr:quinol dehydrogenase ferredoxin subunit NapH [Pseudovibrio brasiliensis]QUS55102.1 quinol dehydrogenase ferredoxin subunit NapH [Pseudovibrio brasiliensis]